LIGHPYTAQEIASRATVTSTRYYRDLRGAAFREITSVIAMDGTYYTKRKRYTAPEFQPYNAVSVRQDPLLVFGNHTSTIRVPKHSTQGNRYYSAGNIPLVIDIPRRNQVKAAIVIEKLIPTNYCATSIMDGNLVSYIYDFTTTNDSSIIRTYLRNGTELVNPTGIISQNVIDTRSGILWLNNFASQIGLDPENPGYGLFPVASSGHIAYRHDGETNSTSFSLDSGKPNSLFYVSGVFDKTPFNFPTYYDREIKTGFWSTKSFDWHYESPPTIDIQQPPSGDYAKTYYYSQTTSPVQYRGNIYARMEFNTGFVYIGVDGPEYIDDDIMYTDLMVFEDKLYAVGNEVTLDESKLEFNYRFTVRTFEGKRSVEINTPISNDLKTRNSRMVIHNNKLYIGIGKARFLVKKPSHNRLSIASN